MNAVLVASIPSLRQDGSPLAATDITSITFQKTTAADPTTEVNLATNTASGGGGLSPDQVTFTDGAAVAGDSYTFFVTDVAGNEGAISNSVVAPAAALSAPAAGTLTATFS
jgi:hypothetical protein